MAPTRVVVESEKVKVSIGPFKNGFIHCEPGWGWTQHTINNALATQSNKYYLSKKQKQVMEGDKYAWIMP